MSITHLIFYGFSYSSQTLYKSILAHSQQFRCLSYASHLAVKDKYVLVGRLKFGKYRLFKPYHTLVVRGEHVEVEVIFRSRPLENHPRIFRLVRYIQYP